MKLQIAQNGKSQNSVFTRVCAPIHKKIYFSKKIELCITTKIGADRFQLLG